MKIGIFDSGLGGLTVLNKAIDQMPPCEYIYMADNKNTPYGIKEKEVVRKYIFECIDKLVKCNCDAIIIACNTATSIAINDLRDMYPNVIIIGTEPAVKKAVDENNDKKRILVCATSMTIKEEKLINLIENLNVMDKVDLIALDKLVEFVESEEIDTEKVKQYLHEKFNDINKDEYGHVVLGCTHFPLLKEQFKEVFSNGTSIIDGSEGIVNNLKSKVDSLNLKNNDEISVHLLLTKESDIFINNFKRISNIKNFSVEIV